MKCQYLPSDLKNYQLTLSLWGFLRDLEVIAESGVGSDMRCVNRSDKLIKPFELLRTGVALEEQIKTRDVGGQKHSVESWNFEHHDHVVLFVLSGKDQIIGRRVNRVNFEISRLESGRNRNMRHVMSGTL
jgi:hypothetical protein